MTAENQAETTRRILVVGDANVDLILRGDVRPRFGQAEQLLEGSRLVLGGSAAITANGLARLGTHVSLVAHLGDDDLAGLVRRALNAAHVGTSTLRVDAGTATGLSVILSERDDRAILTDPGAIPSLTADEVTASLESFSHVHFSSYFLLPRLASELPRLLRTLREAGVTSSVDTNWDPSGQWRGLDVVLPLTDFWFPNLAELRAIAAATLGRTAAGLTDERLAHLVAESGPTVVVKAGAAGAWSISPDGRAFSRASEPLDVVDTTGAGDSFNAAYLAAFAEGAADDVRLRWATAAGALSTMAEGGTAAQPDRAALVAALDR